MTAAAGRQDRHPAVDEVLAAARRRPDGLVEMGLPGCMMQRTATGPTLGELADIIGADGAGVQP